MRLVSVLCSLTALSLFIALPALAAGGGVTTPTAGGSGQAPVTVGPASTPQPRVVKPDLVVRQVEVSRGHGDFPPYTFKITVANTGNGLAGASTTGIVSCSVTTQTPKDSVQAGLLGQAATPAIPAGNAAVITVTAAAIPSAMCLMIVADLPTPTNLSGAVKESRGGNNVLVVPLDTAASFPRTFK